MADGIVLNLGSGGSTACTDDCGAAGHTQVIKLAVSANADATVLPATAANGLTVDVTRVQGTVTVDSELTTADLDTGAGTDTRAVVGLVLAASGGGVLAGAANPVPISDNSGSLTVDGTVAATQSGTWTVQPGNTANTTAWKVDASSVAVPVTDNSGSLTVDGSVTAILTPQTSGGYSNNSINAAASNNATSVKGSAGQVFGVNVYNNAAYPIYVKLYNKATAPAPGTDNALLTRRIGVQAGTQRDLTFAAGLPHSTGIGLAIVKGITDTDNTSVAANDCLVEVEYA